MLRRKHRVAEEDGARIHQARNIGHGQTLLKPIVINEYVRGYYEIEGLTPREISGLRHYVQIQRCNIGGILRCNGNRAKSDAAKRGRNG